MHRRITKLLSFILVAVTAGLAQDPPEIVNADSLFQLALQYQRSNDLSEAEQLSRRILNAVPEYHDARVLVGRIHGWKKEYRLALKEFDAVLSSQPEHKEARLAKAQVLAWQKNYNESLILLRSLVGEDPANAQYGAELAKVLLWNRKPKEAYRFYRIVYGVDSTSTDVIRGLARSASASREYELSLRWYQRLLAFLPRDDEALGNINRLRYRSSYELLLLSSYESFTRTGMNPHSIIGMELYSSVGEDFKPFAHLSLTERFDSKSHRWGGGFYWALSYTTSLLMQGLLAPGATVIPRLDLTAEATSGIGAGLEPVVGYRLLRFEADRVHIVSPGVTWYLSGRFWLTPRFYVGRSSGGSTSETFMLTCSYRLDDPTLVRFSTFRGNEAIQGITLNEISLYNSTGVLLGAKRRLTPLLALELVYQYTSRKPNSNSHFLSLNAFFLL